MKHDLSVRTIFPENLNTEQHGIMVYCYRSFDQNSQLITSKHDRVLLIGETVLQMHSAPADVPRLVLCTREFEGKKFPIAIPVQAYLKRITPPFGGNFVWSHGREFKMLSPCEAPIHVYDYDVEP